eukprot:31089_1
MGNTGCGCERPRHKLILYNVPNTDWANAINSLSVTGVKMLLLQDPDLINKIVTENGYLAIHVAVKRKHFDLFVLLFKHGGNVNALCGKSGHSCLHLAVLNQDIKIIRELFSYGCVDTLVNNNGKTAADLVPTNKFRREYMRAKNLYRNNAKNSANVVADDTSDSNYDSDTSDTDDTDDMNKRIEIASQDLDTKSTEFAQRIGCEVSEIAHCVKELQSENKLSAIWDKWVKKDQIVRRNDLVKLVYGLCVLTLRSYGDYDYNEKPPTEPIKRLTTKIYKMLPIYQTKKHILTKKEFINNFFGYLQDAHQQFVDEYK